MTLNDDHPKILVTRQPAGICVDYANSNRPDYMYVASIVSYYGESMRRDGWWCRGSWILVLLRLLVLGVYGEAPMSGSGILQLTHKYSQKEGSSKQNGEEGMSKEHFQLLLEHDRGRRHGRVLLGGVDFPLGGNADGFVAGLYFTEVALGSPVKHYIVQVDTGSDVLWLNCEPCEACPRQSGLHIPLTRYDPEGSSTQSPVSCLDPLCTIGRQASEADCRQSNNCGYEFQYGDGSTSEGYYLKDVMHYSLLSGSTNSTTNAASSILFGCSNHVTGELTKSDAAVDGIMGFGQLGLSVPNQLASQQKTSRVFSHCLEGEKQGGGILVIGEVSEPGIVYTPLVANSAHYNVKLLSISVGSNKLPIDAGKFSSPDTSGIILDSGTTLAYLPRDAYKVFVDAIMQSTTSTPIHDLADDVLCFLLTDSVDAAFPKLTLNFDGGSSMELTPDNYLLLLKDVSEDGKPVWCLGWQASKEVTILGDLVLKDKLVVYDLENSRIGWVDYNCSGAVKLSGGQSVTATHMSHAVSFLCSRRYFTASFSFITAILVASYVSLINL